MVQNNYVSSQATDKNFKIIKISVWVNYYTTDTDGRVMTPSQLITQSLDVPDVSKFINDKSGNVLLEPLRTLSPTSVTSPIRPRLTFYSDLSGAFLNLN